MCIALFLSQAQEGLGPAGVLCPAIIMAPLAARDQREAPGDSYRIALKGAASFVKVQVCVLRLVRRHAQHGSAWCMLCLHHGCPSPRTRFPSTQVASEINRNHKGACTTFPDCLCSSPIRPSLVLSAPFPRCQPAP